MDHGYVAILYHPHSRLDATPPIVRYSCAWLVIRSPLDSKARLSRIGTWCTSRRFRSMSCAFLWPRSQPSAIALQYNYSSQVCFRPSDWPSLTFIDRLSFSFNFIRASWEHQIQQPMYMKPHENSHDGLLNSLRMDISSGKSLILTHFSCLLSLYAFILSTHSSLQLVARLALSATLSASARRISLGRRSPFSYICGTTLSFHLRSPHYHTPTSLLSFRLSTIHCFILSTCLNATSIHRPALPFLPAMPHQQPMTVVKPSSWRLDSDLVRTYG